MKLIANIKTRIAALENYVKSLTPEMTIFFCEDESEFCTPLGAFEYLYENGVVTPGGKRITFYPHPVDGVDDLSLSLYQLVDEAIQVGRIELPDLTSGEVE